MRILVAAFSILFLSLHFTSTGAGAGEDPRRAGLVAHEWGTFTSLQGSDGAVLEGLHHEEEKLPDFVHSRAEKSKLATPRVLLAGGNASIDDGKSSHHKPRPTPSPDDPSPEQGCHSKECALEHVDEAPAVTQKMETPVIYFYSAQEEELKVNVTFPGGVITQWYPDAQSFAPTLGQIQGLSGGQMLWDIKISPTPAAGPAVPAGNIWGPSREVSSNSVRVGNEAEKFIFYRGLGRFSMPIEVTSEPSQDLRITNQGEETVPNAFLIHASAQGGSIRALGEIPAHGSISTDSRMADEATSDYLDHASHQLETALVHSGLYVEEAHAMVSTWTKSYLKSPGLRVLYVLPRVWTDRLLPLSITPSPQELVRTLVGRIEVMTADEERLLLKDVASQSDDVVDQRIGALGRFAEPKLRRLQVVAGTQGASAEVQARIARLVQKVFNAD